MDIIYIYMWIIYINIYISKFVCWLLLNLVNLYMCVPQKKTHKDKSRLSIFIFSLSKRFGAISQQKSHN